MNKGKYLITGCAGFIGSHLSEKLYSDHELILVDDLSEGNINNLPNKLKKRLIKSKIQNIKNLNLKNLKGVFHLAAQSSVPLSIHNFYSSSLNNFSSSIKVFEIAKKYSVPVVYASSSAIYGNLSLGDDTTDRVSILSPYAQDKLSLEHYAKMFFNIYKIPSIGLRLFNVYGPNQNPNSPYSAVIPIFIKRMKKNLPVIINGGYQTRDFIFVKDVVNVMVKSMGKIQKIKCADAFNVGSNKTTTINNLYKILKGSLNSKSKIIRRNLDKFDPKKSSGTFKRLKKFLNLKSNFFTKLKNGIEITIQN